jgi:hypothetical protein
MTVRDPRKVARALRAKAASVKETFPLEAETLIAKAEEIETRIKPETPTITYKVRFPDHVEADAYIVSTFPNLDDIIENGYWEVREYDDDW